MKRFAAFLRGVNPMNCKMPELAHAMREAGFTDVRTLLSSGNVVFSAKGTERSVQKKAMAAMEAHMDRSFVTFVRTLDALQALVDEDPFQAFRLKPGTKRVVTFLMEEPTAVPKLPQDYEGSRILAVQGREVLCAYVPSPKGAVFMGHIERMFGKDVTTRTWDTVRKVCAAA